MYINFLFIFISVFRCVWKQKLSIPRAHSLFPSAQTSSCPLIVQHPILVSMILNHSVYRSSNLHCCALLQPWFSFYKNTIPDQYIIVNSSQILIKLLILINQHPLNFYDFRINSSPSHSRWRKEHSYYFNLGNKPEDGETICCTSLLFLILKSGNFSIKRCFNVSTTHAAF